MTKLAAKRLAMNRRRNVKRISRFCVVEFAPPAAFQAQAHVKSRAEYEAIRKRAAEQPDAFWGGEAQKFLRWEKPFEKVLDWQLPHAKWFVGGRINASVNCLDRHVEAGKGDKVALLWEGEPGDKRSFTYKALLSEVCRTANALKQLGLKPGYRALLQLTGRCCPGEGAPICAGQTCLKLLVGAEVGEVDSRLTVDGQGGGRVAIGVASSHVVAGRGACNQA